MLNKRRPNRNTKDNNIYSQLFFVQFISIQMLINRSIIPVIGKYINWSISISIAIIAKSGYASITTSNNTRNNMILPKSPFINKTKGLPLVLPSAVTIAKRSI